MEGLSSRILEDDRQKTEKQKAYKHKSNFVIDYILDNSRNNKYG